MGGDSQMNGSHTSQLIMSPAGTDLTQESLEELDAVSSVLSNWLALVIYSEFEVQFNDVQKPVGVKILSKNKHFIVKIIYNNMTVKTIPFSSIFGM